MEIKGQAPQPTHPKPSTDPENMVEFFLSRSVRGVPIPGSGNPVQTVMINGYPFEVKFGARNRVPREVYQVFKDAQSRSIAPNLADAERVPKPMVGSRMGYADVDTLCDYEMELIKEGK